jgi:4-hydroxysphinganine ceramide fatty acyl 2-hydroxylase
MPEYYADAYIAGLLAGYCIYEVWHYFTHFGQTNIKWLKYLRKGHLHHHYYQGNMGYGVTNRFWDSIFGTALDKETYITKEFYQE